MENFFPKYKCLFFFFVIIMIIFWALVFNILNNGKVSINEPICIYAK